MKVTYNWLKDFVEIKLPARVLADKMTMAGLEVTSLEEREGDFVFEIEVTANRPDWLSVVGIAREVAAVTNAKFSATKRGGSAKNYGGKTQNLKSAFKIQIENKKDCPLYTAKIIRNAEVKPSPEWLRKRLELLGCRSVNNIVDITNYVLFEYGEPLHAFDLDKLSGRKIIVRRAQEGEKITTIDASQRALNRDILIIADQDRPVAIAGVMGGRDTEVSWNTKNILLEAAIFDPIVVRRGRQKLGLVSESSYRFERGVDPQMVARASLRAAELIQELAGAQCTLAKSAGIARKKEADISLSAKRVQEILGLNITAAKIKSILCRLGFIVKEKAKDNLRVKVPSFRQDVNLDIDLIEEIARIHGYDKIPTTIPKVSAELTISDTGSLVSLIKDTLVGLGLNEVITYGLIDKQDLEGLSAQEWIEILNPLSQEQAILRPTIIPGLLKCLATNLNQKQGYINIFEIAESFLKHQGSPREELVLGLALCGTRSFFAAGTGLVKEETSLLHLKGILETLFLRLGISDYNFVAPEKAATVEVRIKQEIVGVMSELPRPLLDRWEIKNKAVVAFEVSLEKILNYASLQRKFRPLPRYPGITRDISLLLKEEVGVADILAALKEKGGLLLEEARVADYYKGKQIPSGYKGLTISCLYRCRERTLTEEEINPIHSAICVFISEEFGAQIR